MNTKIFQSSLITTVATSMLAFTAFAQNSSSTAQSNEAASATQTTQVSGAGTPVSTESVNEKPDSAKSPLGRFGLSLVYDTSFSPDAVRSLGDSNLGANKEITSVNLGGISYKLTDATKIALKQYWTQDYGPKADSSMKSSWTVATVSTKWKGILGSDEIAPLFWYYIPTPANMGLDNGITGEQIDHNGTLRTDIEVAWTLTPKWQVSYYFNPRQSIVPGEQKVWGPPAAGKTSFTLPGKGVFSLKDVATTKTTLIHYGILYYNFTDKFQSYSFVGFRNEFLTNEAMYNSRNVGLPAVGLNYNATKNISLNFEVNEEVELSKTNYSLAPNGSLSKSTAQEDTAWLDSHDFNYELVLSLSI